MKPHPMLLRTNLPLPTCLLKPFLAATVVLTAIQAAEAAPIVALWDTGSPLGDSFKADDKSGWKAVPRHLLELETDPAKASSDPGYYGREYAFKGDAVVENAHLVAVFWSAKGRVDIYSKPDATQAEAWPGKKLMEILPLPPKSQSLTITRFELLRNAGDQVAVSASFAAKDAAEINGVFVFDKTPVLEVKPAGNLKTLKLQTALEYGICPSFIGDDLVFGGEGAWSTNTVWMPAENFFLGLLPGQQHELVMTWPKGKQQLRLHVGEEQKGHRLVDAVEFDTDEQSLYVAALAATGIWHKEPLQPSFLENDVGIAWKRPFPARWKTQLHEENTWTSFAFHEGKGQIWRGVAGSYIYPVWFDGDQAFYHLSKKVPPEGESLVYCLEGQDTPPSVSVPVDILKTTLGRAASDALLDISGRKLRTHHRRGGDGVRRACTCGCTEAIQAVFEASEEVKKKEYVKEAVDDMIYFVHRHVERIDEYQRFAAELIKFFHAKASSTPGLKPYLDDLEPTAVQIQQEYEVQKENMKSFAYADTLTQQTMALTGKSDTNNVKAYMELLKAWRSMGGAQDYVLAQCHMITRRLAQEAGYRGASQPETAALAAEIRARCRQCLRNPDGYEIWADY